MSPPQPDALAAFQKYDRNNSGGIEVDELKALLKDLGLLKGLSPHEAASWVVSQFALADRKTKDGALDLTEFSRYYAKVAAPKLLEALTADMPAEVERARSVFQAFASFGATRGKQATELDGARFIKLCKETGLLGAQLTTTDADLIFASVKHRTDRRISFEQFLDALDLVAAKQEQPLSQVLHCVAGSAGPEAHGATQAENVKLHDDRSTYTGMYARRDSGASEGRRPALSRGESCASQPSRARRADSAASGSVSLAGKGRRAEAEACTPDVESRDCLKEAFLAFAGFGTGTSPAPAKGRPEMDSKQFVKLCRESGILDGRRLTTTAADLAFAKAKPLGGRKLGFREFLGAVEQLAQEKGVPKEELFAQVAACSGPRINSSAGATRQERPSPSPIPGKPETDRQRQDDHGSGDTSGAVDEAATAVTEAVDKMSLGTGVISISAVAI